MEKRRVAITGAWSYSGRYVARHLLDQGFEVLSLTNRPVSEPDPFRGVVKRVPFDFSPGVMEKALEGVDVLASAYWSRHNRAPVGHRGPWLSHAGAVERSRQLVEAAGRAGIRRLVWTSIANPGLDPDLSYYEGKAKVEDLVRSSGLQHAILRPACFFGAGGILIENIAWAARHLPVFPIPNGEPYHIRPIFVDDYARLVLDAVQSTDNYTRDAAGLDRPEFWELIWHVSTILGARTRVVKLPIAACRLLYAAASVVMRETILTSDELKGLSRNRLDSREEPAGTASLYGWLEDNASTLGREFRREPIRLPDSGKRSNRGSYGLFG